MDVIEVPFYGSSSSEEGLSLVEGESFQWSCSVTAGEGDQLQWLFNGEPIPSLNVSSLPTEEEVCYISNTNHAIPEMQRSCLH